MGWRGDPASSAGVSAAGSGAEPSAETTARMPAKRSQSRMTAPPARARKRSAAGGIVMRGRRVGLSIGAGAA